MLCRTYEKLYGQVYSVWNIGFRYVSLQSNNLLSTEHRSIYNVYNKSVEYIHFTLPTNNHEQKLLRPVKIPNLFPWCKFSSPPSGMVASPSPFFNVGNNKTSTKHFATLFGEEGVTTDEKDVFIQKQNSVFSWKALVLVNCLNTFVHNCRLFTG